MLPQKTYYKKNYELIDTDFDCNGCLRADKAMQLMQAAAGEHVAQLGLGWDGLNEQGLLWVLSKVQLQFTRSVNKDIKRLTLYTWPQGEARHFYNRLFQATNEQGEELFCAFTSWLIIDKNSRKMITKLPQLEVTEYDNATIGLSGDTERIRKDENFDLAYSATIRQSMLDLNGHVNNTHYVALATDATNGGHLAALEMTYRKELLLNDVVDVYVCHEGDVWKVVGEVKNQPSFFARLLYEA